jgi:squalene synthase HpnC
MRTADDFADENRSAGDEAERLAYLQSWNHLLTECEQGNARHPIFIALSRTIKAYALPLAWLGDLLQAFTMDVTVRRYETDEDVRTYCRYSANPVGRLILTLFGYRDEALYQLSDKICTALQLANHWQDVRVDLEKNRIYLPLQDLARFGLSERSLQEGRATPAFCDLLKLKVDQARQLFSEGEPLLQHVRGRLRLELRMTWLGGVRVLDKIEHVHYDIFNHRPTVTKMDWLRLGLKTLRG